MTAGTARNGARWRPPWADAQAWRTPEYVLEPVRAAMGGSIGLDVATEPDNPTRALRWYALPDDGCTLPWDAPVWCNPPWGDAATRWIRRALEVGQAGGTVALLVPAATDTERVGWLLRGAERVTFLAGRITFTALRPNGTRAQAPGGQSGGHLIATWGLPPLEGLGPAMVPA